MQKFILLLLALPALVWGQDSLNVRRIAQLQYGSQTAAVAVNGELAYVCNSGSGLHVMDVSNPSMPVEIGFCRISRDLFDVAIIADYAVVTVDNTVDHGEYQTIATALYIIDISSPLAPRIVGRQMIDGYGYRVSLVESVAYCAGEFAMYAIDLSEPSHPVVAYNSVQEGIFDYMTAVVADSDYAYLFGDFSGLRVMDFSTPREPVEVASMEFVYPGCGLSKSGNLIFVYSGGHDVYVIDVSDPQNPELTLTSDFDINQFSDFVVIDSVAYCAGQSGSESGALQILNISDLLFPEQLSSVQFADWIYRLSVANGQVYTANSDNGIHIVDVSNPATPHVTGQYNFDGCLRGLALYENYLFVGNDSSGLRVIDVSNPASPRDFGSRDTPGRALGAAVIGHFVYVPDDFAGIFIADVSNPVELVPVDTFDTQGNAMKIFATDDNFAYVANGSAGLLILDVSNPEAPVRLGNYPTEAAAEDVFVRDSLVYLVDRIGLKIFNASDPTALELIGEVVTPGQAHAVQVEGNIAYVAGSQDGLRIIDISNPVAPEEIGSLDTPGNAVGLVMSENHVFIGDQDGGLRVIDVRNPLLPVEVGYYNTPGSAWGIVKNGNYIFLGDSAYFSIYDISAVLSSPEHHAEIPTSFTLHPIYPNPFNNTANISFDLPREVTGRLVVYDVLGRMTNTLYNGKLAAGSHSMQFNGNGLSSGTYFVRLETPTSSATQRAILLK